MGGAVGRQRDVVLIGGGHAHALVLSRIAARPLPGARVTLVTDGPAAFYSGMVPGHLAGQYAADALRIDLARLAARAGARLVASAAVRAAPAARTLETADGRLLAYDVASFDVGSTVAGLDTPGVRRFALATRPVAALLASIPDILARARAASGAFRAVVVGGGAGGIELACALRARLAREGAPHVEVSLLDASARLLSGRGRGAATAIARRCRALGIVVTTGARVIAVEDGRLCMEDGSEIAFDVLLWCAGAAALPLLRACGVPLDRGGFVRVRPTLQIVGHDDLFAVGDAACLVSWPDMPKAGVYAVRAAPVLEHNLRARLSGAPLSEFRPQRDFLMLLNTGDGRAQGMKWGLSFEGRFVFRLKDRIDRGFMARFRADTRDPAAVPAHREGDRTPPR